MYPKPHKIFKEELRFIIENYSKIGCAEAGRQLGVDHTTVLHWVKKLRAAGFKIANPQFIHSPGRRQLVAIEELQKEYGVAQIHPQSTQ